MSFRLRPFISIPTTIRDWTSWIQKALEGSVGTTEIDDEAVTLPKLSIAVQASLTLADSATQPGDLGTAAVQNTGTSGANVPLLSAANTHASAQCTLFGVAITPAGTQAANPDTSGATLGNLEVEVNQLKAVLRTFGLIAP